MTTNSQQLIVKCPICAKHVDWLPEHRYKPFCSERCKLVDLGEWLTEEKKLPLTTSEASA